MEQTETLPVGEANIPALSLSATQMAFLLWLALVFGDAKCICAAHECKCLTAVAECILNSDGLAVQVSSP